jgi:hypothetical protein
LEEAIVTEYEGVVDFSKLKLELYDILGVMLPGLLAICEGWILLRGWQVFVLSVNQISGTSLTLLIAFAFGVGHMVQELGDVTIKVAGGRNYVRQARDKFWGETEAQLVRDAIKKEFGRDILTVDMAFDYCLTKLKDRFGKRDAFVATSDLCRSFVSLSALALAPAARIAFYDIHPVGRSLIAFAVFLLLLGTVAMLSWKRMVRFRELSETTVFRAYLAMVSDPGIHSGDQ